MELNDLSAANLRLVDEICLAFESRARRGEAESIESTLERYRQLAGTVSAEHLDCVRRELLAISTELEGATDSLETPGVFDSSTPSSATPSDQAEGFDSIGPYSVSRVVARGGMGVVYKAFDTRLDRPVAIKVIGFQDPNHAKRQEMVERFEREARAIAALSHPNIVELYDVGTENGSPYAVMEYLRGRTLAVDFGQGAMSSARTRSIGMQIAGALATAHAGGVIHRDLKPQNIMVIEDGTTGETIRVKLVDFGLSRVNQTGWSDNQSDRTRLGTILGTPGYMSPEQARGEPTRNAADIFG
ncbi:MAG: serine/threonine-protein kinase, partial [Planctomycetota bacterium]